MPRPNDFNESLLTSGLRSSESLSRLPSRPRVVATGVAAIIGIAALLGGVPYLLVRFVGNPLPAGIPNWEEFSWSVSNGQIPDRFWVGTLAIIAWVAWAQLAISLTIECVAVIRSTELPAIPTFGLAQGVAAQLVGAVLMLTVVFTTVPVDVAAMGLSDEVQRPEPAVHIDAPTPSSALHPRTALHPDEGRSDASVVQVQVQRRQTLRSLADDHYRDPDRWVEIRDRNVGSTMPDGTILAPGFTRIRTGWTLDIADSQSTFTIGTWQVAPGDHFWSIATTTLAEAYGRTPTTGEIHEYWLEIIEANRELIVSGSPDLIYPGEALDLTLPAIPADVVGATDRLATTTPFPIESILPSERTPSGPAPTANAALAARLAELNAEPATQVDAGGPALGSAAVASQPLTDNPTDSAGPVRTGRYPVDANVQDEDESNDPNGGASAGTSAVTQIAGSGRSLPDHATSGSGARAADPPGSTVSARASTEPGQPVPAARILASASGLGFLAAGFGRALRRRRAMQWARRVEGRIPAQPPQEATLLKNDLASTAADDRLDFVDSTLRAIWSLVDPATEPSVSHIDVTDTELVVHAPGQTLDLAWCTKIGDGSGWRVDREGAVEIMAAGSPHSPSALPLLLSLGRDAETDADLLLNLGHGLVVDLRGPLAARQRFLSAAALELATSRFADDLQVVCCGFGSGIEGLQRAESVDSISDAIELVRSDPFSVIDVTAAAVSETSSNYVILVAPEPSADELDALAQLALSGIASIAPGMSSQWSIALSPGKLELAPVSRTVARNDFTADQFAAMEDLIATSALTEYVTAELLDSPVLEDPGPTDQTRAIDEAAVHAALACDIELRVLGRVEVAGADREFESARALDVITYLAFYRDGADGDQLRTWIWPIDEPPTDKAFANVMTRARKGLGLDDEGEPYLSRAGSDGVYRLAKSVATDFDRFQGHVEYARQLPDQEALEQLVDAIRLVRGVPFTGGGATGYLWADLGVRSQVEFAVDEAAHRCADTALALGDATTARWAAFRGLSIIPGCEQCYRRRFLAAAVDNNRAELATAMAELQKLAAIDLGEPEASDAISPELVELYEELMRHPTRSLQSPDLARRDQSAHPS